MASPIPRKSDAQRVYRYTNIKFPKPVTWTLGASYDNYQDLPVEVKEVNPKFGVQWDVTSNLSVRAASFQWVKPPLLADRTFEPTQVSGFNQVFDNSNGMWPEHRAVGVDWRLTKQLFIGADGTWRDIEVPIETSPPSRRNHCRIRELERAATSCLWFLGAVSESFDQRGGRV